MQASLADPASAAQAVVVEAMEQSSLGGGQSSSGPGLVPMEVEVGAGEPFLGREAVGEGIVVVVAAEVGIAAVVVADIAVVAGVVDTVVDEGAEEERTAAAEEHKS